MKAVLAIYLFLVLSVLSNQALAISVYLKSPQISVSETNASAYIPLARTEATNYPTVVSFITSSDSAIVGTDLVDATGTITIPAGKDKILIPVTIKNDRLAEKTERFILSIISANNADLSVPRTTQVDILDDESPIKDPPQPGLVSIHDMKTEVAISGLSLPIAIQFNPIDTNTAYVAEKSGIVYSVNMKTGEKTVFMDISAKVNNNSDRGLMNIQVHPDFSRHPYVYGFYAVDPPDLPVTLRDTPGNRFVYISRFTADVTKGYRKVVGGSEVVLVGSAGKSIKDISGQGKFRFDIVDHINKRGSDIDPGTNKFKQNFIKIDSTTHVGGGLDFGPDGALYASIGDGIAFNFVDPRGLGVQDINALAGKVIRIDPITGNGLPDNPFATNNLKDNASKVYQLGLRNPYRLTFDNSGRLFISETGWSTYEEINSGGSGANYGWPFYEGGDNGISLQTAGYKSLPEAAAFYQKVSNGKIKITPAYRAFAHDNNAPGYQIQAITGSSTVYSGGKYDAEFNDDYFFSDFSGNEIYSVDTNDRREIKYLGSTAGPTGTVDFQQGPNGYLYYIDIVSGTIVRINSITKVGGATIRATQATESLSGSTENDTFLFTPGTSVTGSIDLLNNWEPGDIIDLTALNINPGDLKVTTLPGSIIKLSHGWNTGDFQLKINLNGHTQSQILNAIKYSSTTGSNSGTVENNTSGSASANTILAYQDEQILTGTAAKDVFVFKPGTSYTGSIDTIINWAPGDGIDLSALNLTGKELNILELSGNILKLSEGWGPNDFQLKIPLNGFSKLQILNSIIYSKSVIPVDPVVPTTPVTPTTPVAPTKPVAVKETKIYATKAVNILKGTKGKDRFIFQPGTSIRKENDTIVNWAPGDRIDISALDLKASDLNIKSLSGGIIKITEGYGSTDFQLRVKLNNFSKSQIMNSIIYGQSTGGYLPNGTNKIYATAAVETHKGTKGSDIFFFTKNTSVKNKLDTIINWAPGDIINLSALNIKLRNLTIKTTYGNTVKLIEGQRNKDFQLKIKLGKYSKSQLQKAIIY